MKDGGIQDTKYELLQPDWYEECYSYLNERDKKEYDLVLNVFLTTSATKQEMIPHIASREVRIFFNIVAMDLEEQAGRQMPKRVRNSVEYKNWRDAVFKRDDYTCQHCGKKGGKLNAHHIMSFKDFPRLRLNVNNGITLCYNCHRAVHRGEFECQTGS